MKSVLRTIGLLLILVGIGLDIYRFAGLYTEMSGQTTSAGRTNDPAIIAEKQKGIIMGMGVGMAVSTLGAILFLAGREPATKPT